MFQLSIQNVKQTAHSFIASETTKQAAVTVLLSSGAYYLGYRNVIPFPLSLTQTLAGGVATSLGTSALKSLINKADKTSLNIQWITVASRIITVALFIIAAETSFGVALLGRLGWHFTHDAYVTFVAVNLMSEIVSIMLIKKPVIEVESLEQVQNLKEEQVKEVFFHRKQVFSKLKNAEDIKLALFDQFKKFNFFFDLKAEHINELPEEMIRYIFDEVEDITIKNGKAVVELEKRFTKLRLYLEKKPESESDVKKMTKGQVGESFYEDKFLKGVKSAEVKTALYDRFVQYGHLPSDVKSLKTLTKEQINFYKAWPEYAKKLPKEIQKQIFPAQNTAKRVRAVVEKVAYFSLPIFLGFLEGGMSQPNRLDLIQECVEANKNVTIAIVIETLKAMTHHVQS